MPRKKKANTGDAEQSDLDRLLEDLKNQPPVEFTHSDDDLSKLLQEINNVPLPDLSFSSDELQKLLEDMSSADSELNMAWLEVDLSELLEDSGNIEPEPIPEPDSNLTARDVAAWMLNQLQTDGRLYQQRAAWHIRRHFGGRFIYINKNNNLAISRDVLKEFLLISLKTVVWNRRDRFWRTRHSSDPRNRRMVDN